LQQSAMLVDQKFQLKESTVQSVILLILHPRQTHYCLAIQTVWPC